MFVRWQTKTVQKDIQIYFFHLSSDWGNSTIFPKISNFRQRESEAQSYFELNSGKHPLFSIQSFRRGISPSKAHDTIFHSIFHNMKTTFSFSFNLLPAFPERNLFFVRFVGFFTELYIV